MCGRYANSETIPAQAARFKADPTPDIDKWKPTWNAAPSQRHPVVIQDKTSRRLGLMAWGWKPDFMNRKMLVNARGEEALGKRTFTEAMNRRRCIVPATAFYEWQERERPPNLPHAFAALDRSLFGIAGLWEPVEIDGKRTGIFLLLTVPANATVMPIHHRMAAILTPQNEQLWLDPMTDGRGATGLLKPSPDGTLEVWPVSMRVNSVREDGEGLLRSVREQK